MQHIKENTLFDRVKIQNWLLEATEDSNVEEMFNLVSEKTDEDEQPESIDPEQLMLSRAIAKSFLVLFKNFTKPGKEKAVVENMPEHLCLGCLIGWMSEHSRSTLRPSRTSINIIGGNLEIALLQALLGRR